MESETYIGYLLMMVYFRSIGGYKPVAIEEGGGGQKKKK